MKIVALINNNKEYTNTLKEYIESLGYFAIGNFFTKEKLIGCEKMKKSSIAIIDHTIQKSGDGIEFAKLTKEINRKIAIIYTVKYIEQIEESSLLEINPQRVLLKPIDRNELRIALKMILT